MNVGDFLKRSASNFPDKTALIFGDHCSQKMKDNSLEKFWN
ncbi:MAG: hypothetical protein M0T73_05225 [Deltaproteobacteria bacterium]|nr:hypothetical protein [Deltaproteobacteria bacterium]